MSAGIKAVARRNRLVSVQLCRGVASLAVVASHLRNVEAKYFCTKLMEPFRHGSIGVDLFFILSGFIIMLSSAPRFGNGSSIPGFLYRRFFRILPIYWVYTAVGLCVYLYNPLTMNASNGHHANIVSSFILHPSYEPLLLAQAWTLIYEIAFYILISTLFFFPNEAVAQKALICWTVLSVGSRIVVHPPTAALSLATSPYNLEFLAGTLLSRLVGRLHRRPKLSFALFTCSILWLLTGISGGEIMGLESGPDWIEFSRWGRPLIYGGASTLFVSAMLSLEGTRLLHHARVLEVVGDWSYSMYLSHIFVIEAIGRFIAHKFFHIQYQIILVDLLSFTAVLAVSAVSYIHLELRLARHTPNTECFKRHFYALLDSDALRQVPWLVDVAASADGYVVGEKL